MVVLPVPLTPTMRMTVGPSTGPRDAPGCSVPSSRAASRSSSALLEIGLGLELALADLVLERLGELDRGGNAEIRLDQDALHLLEIVGVEPAHQRADVGQRDALDAGPEALFPLAQSAVGHAES